MTKKKGPKDYFSMISRSIWRSTGFCSLTLREQHLLLFLMTCQHQTHIGCFHLPDQYALADLNRSRENWTLADYTSARDGLISAGMVDFDPSTFEIMIERWIEKNPPGSGNNVVNMERYIEAVDSLRLAEKLSADLTSAMTREPVPQEPPARSYERQAPYLSPR